MSTQIKASDAHQCKCWMCGRTAIVLHLIRQRDPHTHANIVQNGYRQVDCPSCGKTNVRDDRMLEVVT